MKQQREQTKTLQGDVLNNLINIFENNLVSVVLFGSHARNNYTAYSDIDLLVVVNKYPEKDLIDLRKNFLKNFGKRLDLCILSKEDALNNFRNYSPVFVTFLLGKKILFDRNMFFKKTFDDFIKRIASENIQYCEGNKIWEMKKIAQNLEL